VKKRTKDKLSVDSVKEYVQGRFIIQKILK